MQDLEYRIGELSINPATLRYEGEDSRQAPHRFIAYAQNGVVSIYTDEAASHYALVIRFGLDEENVVGGGNLFLDQKGILVLDGISGDYKAIPKVAAQKFTELVIPKLKEQGITVNGTKVNMLDVLLSPYWRERGFGYED